MSKRTAFTTVTPLPAGITRQSVLEFLHDYEEMIDLNPLVKERHPIPPPSNASADEQRCQWYSLTDKISYFPGVRGDVTYTCAFNDLPNGLQTHCYAPAGLTIRDKWTVGGSLPGEPPQPVEIGLKAPSSGLYLREDVDMRCNLIMTSFVKKTLKKAHAALVDRLAFKAEMAITCGKKRSDSGSRSAVVSPVPSMMSSMGSTAPSSISSISNQYPHLAESIPTSRPPSVASSVSCYSVQSSPTWPLATSSLGTSPALSISSPPSTDCGNSQAQQSAAHLPPPSRAPPPPPTSIPELSFEPISITLSEAPAPADPDTPFLRNAKPATTSTEPAVPVHTPEPETPFLRNAKPVLPELPELPARPLEPETPFLRNAKPNWPLANNWPLPSQSSTAPSQQQQCQQQQQPRPRPRPQTHLFIQPYRPPQPPAAAAGNGSRVSPSGDGLSDDALWQALGGGRVGVAKGMDAAGAGAGGVVQGQGQGQGQSASHHYYHRPQYQQHGRAWSYGGMVPRCIVQGIRIIRS
ncbi:hypothetical protein CHGG_04672 [Chaetomium globosum CBS 148.51]|uniref:DUF7053 domain-containing protein n=1 Tax=Chaetomium globosum (strain ATCC 6205 / CBS 148.51 / DSM 1962 / NBRC 6347 / NRRL 1970) TaxID=306901 RepID=Q2H0M4_CHAGB|nr:uncharacterized protein CHGG_04672 [Chaetomium globosum CBS 148.51]EAQ88053.1 hypothetical protein CHGG_04672 [Chaetomium globosum CBS 148.51]